MAENVELMKYQLDITDVETKAKRMLELTGQIRVGRDNGKDVSKLTDELTHVHSSFARVGAGAQKAGAEVFDFERKGEKLVKGVLGVMSPQLANAADMALDLAEGFNKITPALVGVAGAGAAIGLIVAGLMRMAEAAKRAADEQQRLNKAMAEMEGRGVDARTETAEQLAQLGIDPSQTANALERMAALGGQGVRRELAFKVAAGEAIVHGVSGEPLTADQSDSLIAGFASDSTASLTGDRSADLRTVWRAIETGASPERRQFAANLFSQTGAKAIEEAPTAGEIEAARESAGMSSSGPTRMRRDHPELSDRDFKKVERLLQGESEDSVWGVDNAPPGLRPGTDRSVSELMGIVEQQRGRFGSVSPLSASIDDRPIIINTTNIGTQINGGGSARTNPNFDPARHAPGGGLVDKNPGE